MSLNHSPSDVEALVVASELDPRVAALFELVGLEPPRYRQADVARLTGIPHERSVTWWRAMGFPEVPPDVPAFGEADVAIVRSLATLTQAGLIDDAGIQRLARLLGASFSRIAEAQVAVVEQLLGARPGAAGGASLRDRLAELAAPSGEALIDNFEEAVVYTWRRHLLAAFGRRLLLGEEADEAVVGFADQGGFTKLSQRVPPEHLAEIIDEFERIALDVVAEHGGRAVKLIGDEVMFVTDDLPRGVDIGLDLEARLGEVTQMPDIHCGIAHGPVVAVGGDVFGPAVNLAARLTTIARPGTIVIPRDAVEQLEDRDDIEVVPVRRSFHLKGIGGTRIVAVRRRDGRRRDGGAVLSATD
jgi:adenylate cyclase